MGIVAIVIGIASFVCFMISLIDDHSFTTKIVLGFLTLLSVGMFIYDLTSPIKIVKDKEFVSNTLEIQGTSVNFKEPMKIIRYREKSNRLFAVIKTKKFYTVEQY